MDVGIIKAASEAGMGITSLIALIFVIIYQLKMFSKINETLQRNTESQQANTAVMREMRELLLDINMSIGGCKFNKK